ncbi:uncharacterized protein LOC127757409 [Oryza glaberrima]|uniref:uncharacterized protein LOC127757409 n=1 Tax=Oryza glaberrima TaxID=4538 RepID=UPI00224C609D|nr:uncharacterized protein LOC127757409 [Oryza glaberrima]
MGWTTTRSGAAEWRKQQTAREESSSAACRVIVLLQLGQQRPTVAASIGVGLAVDAAQEWLADGGADDAVDDRVLRRLWRVHQLGGEALETEHLVVVHDYGVDEHTELVVVHQGVRAAAARTDGNTLYNELEVIEGMKLDRGYISPYFITNQKNQKCELDDPLILIHEVSNLHAVAKVLELALKKQRPLLIVAEDLESEALGTLIINKLCAGIKVCAVKAPGFGEIDTTRTKV